MHSVEIEKQKDETEGKASEQNMRKICKDYLQRVWQVKKQRPQLRQSVNFPPSLAGVRGTKGSKRQDSQDRRQTGEREESQG